MNRNKIVRSVIGCLLAVSAGCTIDVVPDEQSDDESVSRDVEVAAEPVGDDTDEVDDDPWGPVRDAGKSWPPDAGKSWPAKDAAVVLPEDAEDCLVPPGEYPDADGGLEPGKDPDAGWPGVPPPNPKDGCFGIGVASGITCMSYDDAKISASAQCLAKGYQLIGLKVYTDPACRPSMGVDVEGTCCPPSTPTFGSCTIDVIGDGKTCLDPDTIKQRASVACQAIKATLTNLVIDNDVCAGGSALAEYECCEPAGAPDAQLAVGQ